MDEINEDGIYNEYLNQIDLIAKNPQVPHTKEHALIKIAKLPSFYEAFGFNTESVLCVTSKHLYTMQLDSGYYRETRDTHYHNLGVVVLKELPILLKEPELVFHSSSNYSDSKLPINLTCVLNKTIPIVHEEEVDGKKVTNVEDCPLVAYIEPPDNYKNETTVMLTAFPKEKYEEYVEYLLKENQLLYLKNEKVLRRDYPGKYTTNITTVPFLGPYLSSNINYYINLVNLYRVQKDGLLLENIKEEYINRKICITALKQNPKALEFIPKHLLNIKDYVNVLESLDKKSINLIPNKELINSLKELLKHTNLCSKRCDILFSTIYKNRLSEEQKTIIDLEISQDKEPSDEEKISKFIEWSEGNLRTAEQQKAKKRNKKKTKGKLKEPSLQNSNLSPASSVTFQEEDITKIINKSLEMENGKITEKGWNDISKTIQMYSDKRYETARYLFVKDGKIIRHVAVSNQNPSSTISQPDKDFLFQLRTYAEKTDSSVVFVHNHPSGYVAPSDADIETTKYIKNFFNINNESHFAGHIILDHGTFGLYESSKDEWLALINEKYYPMERGMDFFTIHSSELKIPQIKRNYDNLFHLSNYAKEVDKNGMWNREEHVPAFFATHNGIIRSLEYIQNDEIVPKNYNSLKSHIKYIGREVGTNHIYFVPQTYQQKMLCEAFAQQSGIVQNIYFEKNDGSFELSNWSGGDIFNSITEDEIKRDDSLNYKIPEIKEKETMEDSINQNNTESVVTNFLLEKLNKAGIETIIDKETYENMLDYVNEVNICLEMLEAEQYPVQMMGEKEKGSSLGAHLGNQQSSGRTLHHKYNISEQERQDMLNDFEKKFDISSFSNDATTFLQQIKERFNLGVEKSDYAHINIDGQKYTIRVSDHGVNTNSVKENEIETSLVIQLPETKNNRFRNQNARAVKQFTYKGNTLTEERQRDILEGLHNYLKTGEFTGKLADDVRSTTAYELQQNLAEQMTLGGIKKGLMTGIALATMFCNMPKVAAETRLLNRDTYQETQIVQLENNIEIINFNDGSKAICNKGNKSDMMDIAIILDENNNPVACYNYDDYMKNLETLGLMEDASITSKSFNVSMDAKNYVAFVNDWQRAGTLSKAYGGGSISDINQQNYENLLNAWLTGGYSEKAQFMIQDSLTYGFTLNNKIYLNPELVNSNTIAHEYTHLWDKYIQKENPTLWENGKEIFKQTSLWNEIINDENYKAISNNEDLILSECHSRICGKFAEEVLNKIALENGNEIKEEVIDWDKEVELFIEKEFGFKNPNYEITNEIDIKSQFAQENYNELKNFLSQPMKDLITGRNPVQLQFEQKIENQELLNNLLNSYNNEEKIEINNEPELEIKSFENDSSINNTIPLDNKQVIKDLSKVIVIDTETTGFKAGEDELLQVSIIDGNGKVLFDKYIKPDHKTEWESAMYVNHISPKKVENAPSIQDLVPEIQEIINNAELLLSYNGRFDMNFLEAVGISAENKPHLDVLKPAASITKFPPKSANDKRVIDGYHYPKLTDVAEVIGFSYKAHNSLGDTTATLEVAKTIYGNNLEKLTSEDLIKYSIDEKKISTSSIKKDNKEFMKEIEISEDKFHSNIGNYIMENHSEILDEIKQNPDNYLIKGLLDRLEKNPDGKNFKTILRTCIGEVVENSYPNLVKEYESTLDKKLSIKRNSTSQDNDISEIQNQSDFEKENIKQMPNLSSSNIQNSVTDKSLEDKINELTNSLETLQNQLSILLEQNNILKKEKNDLTKKIEILEGKQNNVSVENNVSEPGNESLYVTEDKDNATISFNHNTAYNVNQSVPKFGHYFDDGRLQIIDNAHFKQRDLNKEDSSKNIIVLEYADKDGNVSELKLEEKKYVELINAQVELEQDKQKYQEGSIEWKLIHEKYDKRMNINHNVLRSNFASNFRHNFRILCRLHADSYEDAYKLAKDLYKKMHQNEKNAFNQNYIAPIGEKNFDNWLKNEFEEAVKDIDNRQNQFLKNNQVLYEINNDYFQLAQGATIGKTSNKVGEELELSFLERNTFTGRKTISPKEKWTIVKVTKKMDPDTVLLFNKDKKVSKTMSLKSFEKNMQRIEKIQRKEERKELKKNEKFACRGE